MATPATQSHPRIGLESGTAAWLAVPPTVLVVLVAMAVLGPALGDLLFPPSSLQFWSDLRPVLIRPEPTENARYLIALAAPLLLSALTLLLTQRPPRLGVVAAARLSGAIELVTALALAGCLLLQRLYLYTPIYTPQPHVVYFTFPALVVAVLVALLLIAGARSADVRARFASWTAESRMRWWVAGAIAVAATVLTVLPAIVTDASVSGTQRDVVYHLTFTYDETMAVYGGRSPLGDFAAQYASLWPYLSAALMVPFGATLATYTVTMAALTTSAMLALFAILRRVTRSAVVALLLFLPLLATAAWRMHGTSVDRFAVVNYLGTMPLRYAGAFLLAWLTARHLDRAWPRRAWPLFLAAGVVAIDNTDFGVPALGATLAALLWAHGRPSWPWLRTLALQALIGLTAAVALVTALLVIRTGKPPDFSLLFEYTEVFVRGGFGLLPIRPLIGLSTILFATYVIAVGVATVRALREEPDRLLTGLLAWSGIFGLGSYSYYVGRSIPELVEHLFAGWAFALTLLTIVAVRALAARPSGRPTPLEVACLVGFGLLVCSIAQTPAPWSQVDRLARVGERTFDVPPGQAFVDASTEPGDRVAILLPLDHRIASNLGLDDVSLYTGAQSMPTRNQLVEVTQALREAGGSKLFLRAAENSPVVAEALTQVGFRLTTQDAQTSDQMWVSR
jgi:hypothetical protein